MTFAPTYASVTAGRHHPDTAASITVGYDAGMAVAAGFTLIAIIVIRRRPAT